MKPILLFLSLLSFQFSFGQHYFGVKLAPGFQTASYSGGVPYSPTFSIRSGLHYGYRFDETKPWGFQSGIYYNQRGYRINDATFEYIPGVIESGDIINKRNNIGLNLLLKIERNFLYASVGPCFEYNLNRTFFIDFKDEILTDRKYSNTPNNFSEAFYVGYEVNLGLQFPLAEKLQGFTELSVNQVFSKKNEISQNRFSFFNMNLAFGVNYQL